jgi:hypothetical protein
MKPTLPNVATEEFLDAIRNGVSDMIPEIALDDLRDAIRGGVRDAIEKMLGRDFSDIIKDAVKEAISDAMPPDGDINMVISEAVSMAFPTGEGIYSAIESGCEKGMRSKR